MGERIEVQAADGPAEAYLTGTPGDPGVLFYVDAIGLRPRIEEMADRIASWGYVVLAPHVFYRDGSAEELAPHGDLREPGAREAFFASLGDRIPAYTSERAAADAEAWLATLREHAAPGPVGVTGYCMGARLAVRAAAQFPDDVKAVGGFHGGGLVTDGADSPHRGVGASTAEYVFGHADNDSGMTEENAAALDEALEAAGLRHTSTIYPDAPHGYSMSDTSMYQEAGAERHFEELRALLDRTLN